MKLGVNDDEVWILDTPSSWDGALEMLAEVASQQDCPRVALAVPGIVDPRSHEWILSTNLGARDVQLDAWLGSKGLELGLLRNDVSAAAIGEACGGSLALLQIGTGVGCRVVIDGDVIEGRSGQAGEIGHWVVDVDGPLCRCGHRGCLEAIAGWGAIAGELRRLGSRPNPDALVDRSAPVGVRVLADKVFWSLGRAVSAIVAVADPGEIRLGGGLAAAWGAVGAGRIRTELARYVLEEAGAVTEVTVSTLGSAAAIHGLRFLDGATSG